MYAEFKPKVSVMLWRCITWHGSGTLGKVDGNNNAVKYTDTEILDNQLWPVTARNFPNESYVF
jgi:hypothetical protein